MIDGNPFKFSKLCALYYKEYHEKKRSFFYQLS